MKLEGVISTIKAVDELATTRRLTLLVVGEGSARPQVASLADEVNRRHRRRVVIVPGPLADPRPVYEVADVMLGMGGSALRTMAFSTPLIVLGERGFSSVLDQHSLPTFLHQGFYGVGDGSASRVLIHLEDLLDRPDDWTRLGQLGGGLPSRTGTRSSQLRLD